MRSARGVRRGEEKEEKKEKEQGEQGEGKGEDGVWGRFANRRREEEMKRRKEGREGGERGKEGEGHNRASSVTVIFSLGTETLALDSYSIQKNILICSHFGGKWGGGCQCFWLLIH